MAKKAAPTANEASIAANDERMIANVATMRTELMNQLLDTRRDIDNECGYPDVITTGAYRKLYDREGIAERVVGVYPQESWAMDPEFRENEDATETAFELAWDDLDDRVHCMHYLQRIDELSGVGHYGLLLLGLADGKELHEPVDGMPITGELAEGVTPTIGNHKLLYLRAFDESLISITQYEKDVKNPRFGLPTEYDITFHDPKSQGDATTTPTDTNSHKVHWHRVMHVADNRKNSEVFGTPRMKPVYNRLYDLRKLLGGSAEMFWKGAFPGYSFEVDPETSATIDRAALRTEIDNYSNGLQRYLATVGVKAVSLDVQVADPAAHVQVQLQAIALTIGVPLRVLLGSEQAKLAADQDSRAWNKRLQRRQVKYIDPMLIRPFVDRLIMLGILPEPADGYEIAWPDLNAPTDSDKAEVAAKQTEALAKYVAGGVDTVIPPFEYLTIILGLEDDVAEAIQEAALNHILAANPDAEAGEVVQGRNPTPPPLEEGDVDPATGKPVPPATGKPGEPAPGTKTPPGVKPKPKDDKSKGKGK